MSRGEDGVDLERITDPVHVANEFAYVNLCKVRTRNGERLEISSPKLGYRILLDPLQLESLTWQTAESLSTLLLEPFGPEKA